MFENSSALNLSDQRFGREALGASSPALYLSRCVLFWRICVVLFLGVHALLLLLVCVLLVLLALVDFHRFSALVGRRTGGSAGVAFSLLPVGSSRQDGFEHAGPIRLGPLLDAQEDVED